LALAAQFKSQFGGERPKIFQVNFTKAKNENLMPDAARYEGYLNSFVKRT